jgi:hypothetical protein
MATIFGRMARLALLGAALVFASTMPTHAASSLTYEITATIQSGPLTGEAVDATLFIDSSLIPSGGTGQIRNTSGVGASLSLVVAGFTFPADSIDATALEFEDGLLVGYFIGTDVGDAAGVAGITVPTATLDIFLNDGVLLQPDGSRPFVNAFEYAVPGFNQFFIDNDVVRTRLVAVPEPVTYLLLACGLPALLSTAWMQRHREGRAGRRQTRRGSNLSSSK